MMASDKGQLVYRAKIWANKNDRFTVDGLEGPLGGCIEDEFNSYQDAINSIADFDNKRYCWEILIKEGNDFKVLLFGFYGQNFDVRILRKQFDKVLMS